MVDFICYIEDKLAVILYLEIHLLLVFFHIFENPLQHDHELS